MQSRKATGLESVWLALSYQIPCIVCSEFMGIPGSPAEIHHLDGKTKPGAHLKSISMCSRHHRIKDNHVPSRWVSFHANGRKMFEAKYATMEDLLEIQSQKVTELRSNTI